MVYQAEKVIKENESKIPAELKTEVEAKLSAVREAAKGSDTDSLKKAMDELNDSLQKIGQHIYAGPSDSSGTDGTATGDGSDPKPKSEEEDVVDAEYKEV
jgi:molecular chaperone DnaK